MEIGTIIFSFKLAVNIRNLAGLLTQKIAKKITWNRNFQGIFSY